MLCFWGEMQAGVGGHAAGEAPLGRLGSTSSSDADVKNSSMEKKQQANRSSHVFCGCAAESEDDHDSFGGGKPYNTDTVSVWVSHISIIMSVQ